MEFETQEQKSFKVNSKTGITNFTVQGYNPSNEQYKEITGEDLGFTLNYELSDDGKMNQVLLVHNPELGFQLVYLDAAQNQEVSSSTGKKCYVNNQGKVSIYHDAETLANDKYFTHEGERPVLKGEKQLYELMKIVMKYNSKMKTAFMDQITENDLKFADILKGKFDKFQEFFTMFADNQFSMVVAVEIKNGYANSKAIPRAGLFYECSKVNDYQAVVEKKVREYVEKTDGFGKGFDIESGNIPLKATIFELNFGLKAVDVSDYCKAQKAQMEELKANAASNQVSSGDFPF